MEALKELDEVQIVNNDKLVMDKVLSAYFENTRYLKNAEIEKCGDPSANGKVSATCEFSIPESCYINDTGHFNSVEFNICYNQMMYYVIAESVKHGLMDIFSDWDMDTYWEKQLPDVLIVNFQSTFKRPMRATQFTGEIDFMKTKVKKLKSHMFFINTICRFYDDNNGYCEGKVDLAIIN